MLLRELFHDIDQDDLKPLKKDDTIRVFHGFNNHNTALLVAKKGLSGAQKVPRVYSYESDNNPKGLFVTGKFKVAAEFVGSYKLAVIMEFVADYSELEAPVWPGGSWTGFGGYSQYFGWGPEGRRKRHQTRKDTEKSYKDNKENPEWVSLSDNPHMADMLLNKGESQALFVGHLNPNRIVAFYVKPVKDLVFQGDWVKLSRDEFLEKYQQELDPKHNDENKYKMFSPDENFSPEVFKERLLTRFGSKTSMDLDNILGSMWNRIKQDQHKMQMFQQYIGMYLWPKQMPAAFNWFKREYKNSPE